MADDEVHQGLSAARAHEMMEMAKTQKTGTQLRQTSVKATGLLDNLKSTLIHMADMKRAAKYCKSIDHLQSEAKLPRFVIGVLGDTGTGKSSLINAVLDEERVVPTNCMRACTAVITEISYNTEEDAGKKYRAEIDFLSRAEWTQELLQLHRDILDDNGKISKDTRDESSDAGTAYAIIRSVYPDLTPEELEQTHPTALASRPVLQPVLGQTMTIEEKTCDVFYDKVQAYVDSEENGKSQVPTIAYWPLVRAVRIFLKSKVLSTGVVLVDLPGSRDSNSARAAVAAKYTKECTRLWIIAPITRAVNDRTAKTLLGQHFRQQLKFDGSYSNITFICTKADDVALDEATETLGIRDTIQEMHRRWKEIKPEIEATKKSLKKLEAHKSNLHAEIKVAGNEIDNWHGIYNKAMSGERVFAPFESPRKRKRHTEDEVRKKVKKEVEYSDTEESSDESDEEMPSQQDDHREPLTAEMAGAKLQELKDMKKSLRDEKKEVSREVSKLKSAIADLTAERSKVNMEMHRLCIQGRNKYSREEIQKDFAFGLKELDDELLAEQAQSDGQPPEVADIDYERIGRDLPVYCISSRSYQQLRGRMKKDRRVAGFTTLEETEVPGLQRHTLEFAATVQDGYFKSHLNEICRLLRGIDLFLAGDEATLKMSDAERQEECKFLEKAVGKLRKTLEESVTSCMQDCETSATKVLKRLPKAASKGSAAAVAMAKSWSASPDAGGLRFPTYRATCRRRGVFKGAAGPRDFNEDLLKAMKNIYAQSWDQSFNKRFPELLDNLALTCDRMIGAFQARMKGRRFLTDNTNLVQSILTKHVAAMKETQIHIAKQHKQFAQDHQRGANRMLYPAIEGALRGTYGYCAQVKGGGAFITIRSTMEKEIEKKRATMFYDAASDADSAVHTLLEGLEEMVRRNVTNVINIIEQDYTSLIGTVATEADKRDRKMLAPVMNVFYQELLVALSEPDDDDKGGEEIVIDNNNVDEDEDDDGDGDYHDSE
ncbi:Nuclear GTPase SLIP-GC [Colletotrichum siamense]|nr:Nuclear GTPase SLIP-GC [Colletotrichum siamense]